MSRAGISRRVPDARLALAMAAAKAAYRATRLLGKSGGTALPGLIAERIDPRAIAKAARSLSGGAVVVAGTNGKTTTARLLTEILTAGGHATLNNGAGSNLSRGIAATFARASGPTGRPRADIAVLETDEAAFPAIVAAVRPRMVVLNNLFRDQLDRYGELHTVSRKWGAALATLDPGTLLVYDADDPTLCDLAARHAPPGIVHVPFGLGPHPYALSGLSHAADTTRCPLCGTPLRYHTLSLGHLGDWYCPTGDNARPPLAFTTGDIALRGMEGATFAVQATTSPVAAGFSLPIDAGNPSEASSRACFSPPIASKSIPGGLKHALLDLLTLATTLPGLYNVYNTLGAVAAATALGVSPHVIAAAVKSFVPPFGRIERVPLRGRRLTLLLIKNPTGANEVLRLINTAPPAPLLICINDLAADGRDVSWLWDTDFEMLADYPAPVIVSGIRAADMAVRLKYAGLPETQTTIVPEIADALVAIAERADTGGDAYILPTYTAMLAAREALHRQGALRDVWASAERRQ